MAEHVGFRLEDRVRLRERISKGGERVRQDLLVFIRPNGTISRRRVDQVEIFPKLFNSESSAISLQSAGESERSMMPFVASSPSWVRPWEAFKLDLPHQQHPYSKRNWGGAYHSMCSYQGKIKPALAHHLVKVFSTPGDLVVDPFSGAGTIPLEASFEGRNNIGLDISELGYVLTLGKLGNVDVDAIIRLLDELAVALKTWLPEDAEYESAAAVSFNGSIPEFYHPETLREVLIARRFFRDTQYWYGKTAWGIVCSSLLHILHGNRPYALSRRSHSVTPYKPTGPVEYRSLMSRLRDKVDRILTDDRLLSHTPGQAFQSDCTEDWPVEPGSVDAVITSPPFFDSTRFYMTNWLRYWFVGWERKDFDTRPNMFLETRQKKSLAIYEKLFQQSLRALRPTGVMVMHLGKSLKCDMASELARLATPFFTVADVFAEGVDHCESHGIRDKGTTFEHTYLVLIPPPQN